jgi:hypothetical protein
MDFDEVLRALAHPKRREAIRYCRALEADSVTADRLNREAFDGDERSLVELHHSHLPKLDDAGLLEYDGRTRTVRLDDPPPFVDEVIDSVDDAEGANA